MRALTYTGPDAPRTRWLQFIWREVVVTHPVSGTSRLAGTMGTAETVGFMQAVADCAPLGYSLYAFSITTGANWSALHTLPTGRRPCT